MAHFRRSLTSNAYPVGALSVSFNDANAHLITLLVLFFSQLMIIYSLKHLDTGKLSNSSGIIGHWPDSI